MKRFLRVFNIMFTVGIKTSINLILIKVENFAVKIFTPLSIFVTKYIFTLDEIENYLKNKVTTKYVLIVMEDRYSASVINRVYNLAEYLRLEGWIVDIAKPIDLLTKIFFLDNYSVVLLQRTMINKLFERLFEITQKLKIPTIYDCDDLVFDPTHITSHRFDIKTPVQWWIEKSIKYKAVLEKCNYYLASTEYLSTIASNMGKKSFILRNGLDSEFIKNCGNYKKLNFDNRIVIGYMSGSASHNSDFALVSNAISELMQKYDNVYLKVIGMLELPEIFKSKVFRRRVQKVSLVNFYKLPKLMSNFDINIAPLEYGSPFIESKSELKYVYAGVLSVPTVASPSQSYKYAITEGYNGLLASNEEEWHDKLEMLIKDELLMRSMGENAYNHVQRNYYPKVMAKTADEIFTYINNTVLPPVNKE